MKYRYVFVLGRPGCGKSALYRELEGRILEGGQAATVERVDDFPKLWALVVQDDAREAEGKERIWFGRTEEGDLCIINDGFLDLILREVNLDLLEIDRPDHLVFIEFARGNYVGALLNFDRRILENCAVIYLEASFETCWARNVARHAESVDAGSDDHLVPRGVMEKRYLHDDRDALVRYLEQQGIPVAVVNNEADGEEHLLAQVEELCRDSFLREAPALR
jgi:hypothetical protein